MRFCDCNNVLFVLPLIKISYIVYIIGKEVKLKRESFDYQWLLQRQQQQDGNTDEGDSTIASDALSVLLQAEMDAVAEANNKVRGS